MRICDCAWARMVFQLHGRSCRGIVITFCSSHVLFPRTSREFSSELNSLIAFATSEQFSSTAVCSTSSLVRDFSHNSSLTWFRASSLRNESGRNELYLLVLIVCMFPKPRAPCGMRLQLSFLYDLLWRIRCGSGHGTVWSAIGGHTSSQWWWNVLSGTISVVLLFLSLWYWWHFKLHFH